MKGKDKKNKENEMKIKVNKETIRKDKSLRRKRT